MSKFEYAIPPELSEHEQQVLESKRAVCFDTIHGLSLRWLVVTDEAGRPFCRLTDYSRPSTCFFEATLNDIENMEDWQFKNAIVGNERPCSDAEP